MFVLTSGLMSITSFWRFTRMLVIQEIACSKHTMISPFPQYRSPGKDKEKESKDNSIKFV